jgi:hypothetical protein
VTYRSDVADRMDIGVLGNADPVRHIHDGGDRRHHHHSDTNKSGQMKPIDEGVIRCRGRGPSQGRA